MNLKRFCKKISDGTLVTHFVCTGFRNLATIKQKSDAYEKGIVYFIFVFGFSGSANAQFISGNTEIMLTQKDEDRTPPGQTGDVSPENVPKTRGCYFPTCVCLLI